MAYRKGKARGKEKSAFGEHSIKTAGEIANKHVCRGFTKGWFSSRMVLADVPPERKLERGYIPMFPRNETRTRVHSPKPPHPLKALRALPNTRIANHAGWERGSTIGNSRQWLREGAKGLLDPGSRLPRVSCSFRSLFCTAASPFCTIARGFSLLGTKDLFHPLLTTFGNSYFDPLSQAAWSATLGYCLGEFICYRTWWVDTTRLCISPVSGLLRMMFFDGAVNATAIFKLGVMI